MNNITQGTYYAKIRRICTDFIWDENGAEASMILEFPTERRAQKFYELSGLKSFMFFRPNEHWEYGCVHDDPVNEITRFVAIKLSEYAKQKAEWTNMLST